MDGNADIDQAKIVYDSLAKLPVGEGWIWAPDHDLLERVKFPAIRTLDTSKTPKAGDARITAPVLATADLAKITKQIQAIQSSQAKGENRKTKRAAKTMAPPALVPARKSTDRKPEAVKATKKRNGATVAAPSELGAAIMAARTAADLSQMELATRLKTKQSNIVRLEKGRSQPSTRTLQRIAKATGHKLVIRLVRQ